MAEVVSEHTAAGRERSAADGTLAMDMDPLSQLCRLATSVPPPRLHTIKYAWRARGEGLAPKAPSETPTDGRVYGRPEGAPSYRP
jgi:hypothetical protein